MEEQAYYYTKEHEWVKLQEGNVVRVGITTHAAQQLGDIVFVEYLVGEEEVEAGAEVASVESVKSVSDVYAPVAGKIVQQNEELNDRPELVNESPMEDGWMFDMEISGSEDLQELLTEEEYEALVAEEE